MDSFATTVSVALQYGVPLRDLVNKFAHVRFEPSGFTGNQEIPIAKSIVDYIFRWLGSRFLSTDDKAMLGLIDRSAIVDEAPTAPAPSAAASASSPPTSETAAAPAAAPAAPAVEPTAAESDADTPTATAVAAESAEASGGSGAREELSVIATNGHANGHGAANGSGKTTGSGGGNGGSSAITMSLGATKVSFQTQADAPSCADCGSIMVRNGSCYKCLNCGSTSGCS
jgi:ribonucleoside-diphosphate reductase alpha chain